MAISTYKVFLMTSEDGSSWEKLIDIKSFPNLGGSPERLETTTLSDGMQTFINGIQQLDAMEVTANYTKTDYTKVKAIANTKRHFAFWFGGTEAAGNVTPTGTDGKFKFEGELSVYITGGGVNEVVGMSISLSASTPIQPDETV